MNYPRTSLLLSLICAILFSNVLVSMEKEEFSRIIPSLKQLCMEHYAAKLQETETLQQFINGDTKYHLLPEELHEQITSYLPSLCVVNKAFTVDGELMYESREHTY